MTVFWIFITNSNIILSFLRINPVTKKLEPYLPPAQKVYRIVVAYTFVLFMVSLKCQHWRLTKTVKCGCCTSIWSYIRYRWNIVLTLQLCVVLASVIAVMLYRAVMLTVFYRVSGSIGSIAGQQPSSYASLMVTTTATSINLICIIVLNQVIWINYRMEW